MRLGLWMFYLYASYHSCLGICPDKSLLIVDDDDDNDNVLAPSVVGNNDEAVLGNISNSCMARRWNSVNSKFRQYPSRSPPTSRSPTDLFRLDKNFP